MNIAFVYENSNVWSGVNKQLFTIQESVSKESGGEIFNIEAKSKTVKMYKNFYKLIFGPMYMLTKKQYHPSREPLYIKLLTKNIQKQLNEIDKKVDIIFATDSRLIMYLKTSARKVYFADATFHAMLGYYPNFTNLSNRTIRLGEMNDYKAIHETSLAAYSSDWAVNSAVDDYKGSPQVCQLVHLGYDNTLPVDQINTSIYSRLLVLKKEIRLLFSASVFSRKGGNTALQLVEMLNRKGIAAKLIIVGCECRINSKYVENYGFLDLRKAENLKLYRELFLKSNFFILPTEAECAARVNYEACSFGLPIIITDTGGASSLVKNYQNGIVLKKGEYCNKAIEFIMKMIRNPEEYQKLMVNSIKFYQDNFSNQSIVERYKRLYSTFED